MRILLIGTGYVGMALLSSWENIEDCFWCTTTTESKLEIIQSQKKTEKALLFQSKKSTDLKEIIDKCDAMIVTVAPIKGVGYKETYLETALSIKEGLKKRTRPLFLLYTSSTSVYGDHNGAVVKETSNGLLLPEKSHILSEAENIFLSCANSHIAVCILRLGGIYGPLRTLEKRAEKFSNKIIGGSGEEPTNHIHLDEITHAIEFCVKEKLNGIYNLVNDDHPSRKKLYKKICEQLKLIPPNWEPCLNSSRTTNAIVSNEKIKNAGYVFSHPHIPFLIELV